MATGGIGVRCRRALTRVFVCRGSIANIAVACRPWIVVREQWWCTRRRGESRTGSLTSFNLMRFTSCTSLSPYRARTVVLALAPTCSQAAHLSAMALMSSSSIFLYFSALMMMLKSVTANGVRAIWNTLVPRFAILFSTYRFAPWTMVITVMSVATPIVSPSMVSDARSLWA